MVNEMRKVSKGQGLVEYGLVLVLVALVTGITVTVFGDSLADLYADIISGFNDKSASQATVTPTEEVVEDEEVAEQTDICGNETSTEKAWKISSSDKKEATFDGQLCLSNIKDDEITAFNQCSAGKEVPDDYDLVLSGADLKDGEYGVLFRVQNTGYKTSGYSLQYDETKDAYLLIKLDKGISTTLAVGNVPDFSPYTTSHDLSVEVNGSTITAYVNGVQILNVVDDSYSSGSTGLQVFGKNAEACFSDFSLKTIIE